MGKRMVEGTTVYVEGSFVGVVLTGLKNFFTMGPAGEVFSGWGGEVFYQGISVKGACMVASFSEDRKMRRNKKQVS